MRLNYWSFIHLTWCSNMSIYNGIEALQLRFTVKLLLLCISLQIIQITSLLESLESFAQLYCNYLTVRLYWADCVWYIYSWLEMKSFTIANREKIDQARGHWWRSRPWHRWPASWGESCHPCWCRRGRRKWRLWLGVYEKFWKSFKDSEIELPFCWS